MIGGSVRSQIGMQLARDPADFGIVRTAAACCVVLTVSGHLDVAAASRLLDELSLAGELGQPLLVVDLDQVSSFTPGVLDALAAKANQMAKRGGQLVIVWAHRSGHHVIAGTGLPDPAVSLP